MGFEFRPSCGFRASAGGHFLCSKTGAAKVSHLMGTSSTTNGQAEAIKAREALVRDDTIGVLGNV
jgi:hypothetical protein